MDCAKSMKGLMIKCEVTLQLAIKYEKHNKLINFQTFPKEFMGQIRLVPQLKFFETTELIIWKYRMSLVKVLLITFCLTQVFADIVVTSQTDFYIQWLPALDYDVDSGYVSVKSINGTSIYETIGDTSENQLFYQFIYKKGVKAATVTSDQPIVIWLQGGPGCGGATGLYQEIGPFVVKEDATTKGTFTITERAQSWNKQAHLLFIDQPFNSGYSYTNSKTPVKDSRTAAKYFTDFLKQFLDKYTQFATNPIYLFGESYAGHYIPAFSKDLLTNDLFSKYKANYKGVGIGDGLTQALNQVTYYSQYLYAAGLIDDKIQSTGIQQQSQVQQLILQNKLAEAGTLQDKLINGEAAVAKVSVYNIWSYGDTMNGNDYQTFLGKYRDTLKVPATVNVKNESCNDQVYTDFVDDITADFSQDLVFLLDKGQVLLYNGQLDFIINTPGALNWINNLNHEVIENWKKQDKQIFQINQKTVGTYKQFGSFTFTTVYQAGHLVPMDQPETAYAMLSNFLAKKSEWI